MVRAAAQQHVAGHGLVGAGGAQAVGARQVDDADVGITNELALTLVDGDARVVGDLGVRTGEPVEEHGLAAVGGPQQGKDGGAGFTEPDGLCSG